MQHIRSWSTSAEQTDLTVQQTSDVACVNVIKLLLFLDGVDTLNTHRDVPDDASAEFYFDRLTYISCRADLCQNKNNNISVKNL